MATLCCVECLLWSLLWCQRHCRGRNENMAGLQIHERTISFHFNHVSRSAVLIVQFVMVVTIYVIEHPVIRNHPFTTFNTPKESLWRSMILPVVWCLSVTCLCKLIHIVKTIHSLLRVSSSTTKVCIMFLSECFVWFDEIRPCLVVRLRMPRPVSLIESESRNLSLFPCLLSTFFSWIKAWAEALFQITLILKIMFHHDFWQESKEILMKVLNEMIKVMKYFLSSATGCISPAFVIEAI